MKPALISKILIIGFDSKVGQHFYKFYNQSITILGTTRRKVSKDSERFYLDLTDVSSIDRIDYTEFDFVIISSALTSILQCKQQKDLSYKVNVIGISNLIDKLTARGTPFIFISSTCVFGESQRYLHEDQDTIPNHEYGFQKRLIEDRIKSNSFGIVLRTTKLLDHQEKLIQGWINSLIRGQPINAFADLYISPVSYESFCEHILDLMSSQITHGIFHISPTSQLSYFDLALALSHNFSENHKDLINKESCIDKDFVLYKPAESFLICNKVNSKALSLKTELGRILEPISCGKEVKQI